uniref:Uncharacterized protein n=1 Tax=Anopheles christyi TaxID=43041 RepID=A0A182JUN2_9DIPT
MTPKPEESIPVVHVGDDRELSEPSLNNSASLSNLSANLKLNAFINNGFVSDCAQAEKLAGKDYDDSEKDDLRKGTKNTNQHGVVMMATNGGAAVAEKPVVDFDDLLPHVGEFGRYQKILFLLMIPFAFFVAFVYFSQIFITLVPEEHWCYVPELQHLSVEESIAIIIGWLCFDGTTVFNVLFIRTHCCIKFHTKTGRVPCSAMGRHVVTESQHTNT